MMSALSDVFERSSQERSSADRTSAERRSLEQRRSNEARRSAERQSSSSASDHGFELREIRIVDVPEDVKKSLPSDSEGAAEARAHLFQEYKQRVERLTRPPQVAPSTARPPRGPASSSQAARSAFADAPAPARSIRDSNELRRSGQLPIGLAPSMTSASSIPAGEDPAAFVVQATLDRAAAENAQRKSFQAPRLGVPLANRMSSVPQRVRISLDNAGPATSGQPGEVSAVQSIGATLVRRRRRLPWKLLLTFGIVSCMCLIVALTTMSIGIYNFTKLRASRAARSVEQLRDEIEPQLVAIMKAVGAMRRFF